MINESENDHVINLHDIARFVEREYSEYTDLHLVLRHCADELQSLINEKTLTCYYTETLFKKLI